MKLFALLAALGVAILGCAPAEEQAQSEPPTTQTSSAPEAASEPEGETVAAAPTEAAVGMGMADVKKALGAPDDSRHDHGEGDSELDIWVYADQEVKFENGKVVEIVKL